MIDKIVKRDGRIVPFDVEKIEKAIYLALKESGYYRPDLSRALADEVCRKLEEEEEAPAVEHIQDLVEQSIMANGYPDVARKYIIYRNERSKVREMNSNLMKIYEGMTYKSSKDNNLKRENANVNADTAMGMMLKYGSEGAKKFNELFVLDPKIAKAHREGDIHIHDLDFMMMTTTCMQIDILELFKGGFCTGHGHLREPQDIRSYAALACIAIQSNQNDQHGGQSIPNFDYGLAPGVAKTFRKLYISNLGKAIEMLYGHEWSDKIARDIVSNIENELKSWPKLSDNNGFDSKVEQALKAYWYDVENAKKAVHFTRKHTVSETKKATYQAMEALIHNLNSMASRAGAQVPFSSINYGTDTSPEGRMVMECVLEATEAGLGNGETPIFPIQIFKVREGVNYNPSDPNYDLFKLACKVSAKRLFPNFSFMDAPFNKQYLTDDRNDYAHETSYMGCTDYFEQIYVQIDGNPTDTYIGVLYDICKDGNNEKTSGISHYIDVSEFDIKILDSYSKKYVKVLKVIRNPNLDNWKKIIFNTGKSVIVTSDHPFPVYGKGRTLVKDMKPGDAVPFANNKFKDDLTISFGKPIYSRVKNICDINIVECSYDVETESDRFDLAGIFSHNCRTRVMGNVHDPSKETSCGRGNLSFTSINLPRLAIQSGGDIDLFFELLDEKLDLVIKQLDDRFKIQSEKTVRNYPFLMGEGVWLDSDKLEPDDKVGDVLKHGTLTVGFIGLAECLKALIGKHHGESKEAQEIGLRIIGHMRERTDAESQKKKLNYSVIATPAEGLSGRFVRLDKERYGIIEGVTDREYYTNSFHIPVYFPITAFEKIRLEAPYHALTNGGHITYIELDGDPTQNLEAFEQVIRYMKECGIGYGSINHPVDRDPVCGYTGIIGDTCPRCGRHDGEGISVEKLKKLGLHKNDNADTIGYQGDYYEEQDRLTNPLE